MLTTDAPGAHLLRARRVRGQRTSHSIGSVRLERGCGTSRTELIFDACLNRIPTLTGAPGLSRPLTSGALACAYLCFHGTSVQSGTGTAGATDRTTYFGQMVGTLVTGEPPSRLQRGIDDFTVLKPGWALTT